MEARRDVGRILLGIILSVALAPVALVAWFQFGHPPVAVADPPLPHEEWIANFALDARIHREMVALPPVQADEDTFKAGAWIYREQCAACHGYFGKAAHFGGQMYPAAPPLWEQHGKSTVVGVSDDPPSETFWKVENGIRYSGMPAFKNILTETQMWQVSMLVANADKPLPPEVLGMMRGEELPTAKPDVSAPKP